MALNIEAQTNRVVSLPATNSLCPDGQIGKVVSLKRRNVVSSNLTRGTKLCGCEAEWLGYGLQIRFMQVRSLSPTPKLFVRIVKISLDFHS